MKKMEKIIVEEMKRYKDTETEWKPVRPYRSQAEKTAVTQRNIQIVLSIVILALAAANLMAELGVF